MPKTETSSITDLEIQIAHLTRSVEDISDVLADQGKSIAKLERRVTLLIERLADQDLGAEGSIPLADSKPPHW